MFILRRLNAWEKRFGFVRFIDVRNAHRLAKEMDELRIGSLVLHVNIPMYRRAKHQGEGREEYVSRNRVLHLKAQGKKKVCREKRTKEVLTSSCQIGRIEKTLFSRH